MTPTSRILVPNDCVGTLIGMGGEMLRQIQLRTSTKIQISQRVSKEDSSKRTMFIEGHPDQIMEAKALIDSICKAISQQVWR